MATWETKTPQHLGAPADGGPVWHRPAFTPQLIIIVGLILFLVGTAPYWSKSPGGTEFAWAPSETAQVAPPQAVTDQPSPVSPSPQLALQQLTPSAPRAQVQRKPQPGSQRTRQVAHARRFVVSFGSFSRRTRAETAARTVRGKGYLATVTRVGGAFHVFSRAFRDRQSAEFWSKVYSEIGLSAKILSVNASARHVTITADTL